MEQIRQTVAKEDEQSKEERLSYLAETLASIQIWKQLSKK